MTETETGPTAANDLAMRIESAFEDAGIRFLDKDSDGGIGVRLAR